MKLNLKPSQIVREQEELYRKELKGMAFSDEEWIDIIVQNPRLLQRPVVEGKYRAVIAIPAERVEELNPCFPEATAGKSEILKVNY